ncbi:MAG TPA: ThiF family adenylyltransferase [Mycobacteriales bacterium]|jgi:molybdopterin/thiamine biosynthesis adenylyltransferase|nr:ThiF family adenylyltransferase [Mycobacteriales bacterium]
MTSGGADDERATVLESLRLSCQVAKDALHDALARVSFRQVAPDVWRGLVEVAGDATLGERVTFVEVTVREGFPFVAPKVVPNSREWAEAVTGRSLPAYYEATRSWHREPGGAMCLFVEADHTRLPWADGDALLDQVRAWLAQDAAGWADPDPALDLERYVPMSNDRALVLYTDLERFAGQVVRLHRERNDVLRVGRVAVPQRVGRRGGSPAWPRDVAAVVDAGTLEAPVTTWPELLDAVEQDGEATLRREFDRGLRHVLLLYRRAGTRAVLALELVRSGANAEIRFLQSAPDDAATRLIRAHRGADVLATKRVAVIGSGAIGSVLADLLDRSGVGDVTLVDSDRVLPGNTRRHLAGNGAVGLPKPTAVADAIRAARPLGARIHPEVKHLTTIEDAVAVLAAHELVIDATADSAASALLAAAARVGAGAMLSVAVLADGYAVRVDREPLAEGAVPLPATPLPPLEQGVYEAGCGSPVSTTPPAAVWEAAAVAARHATQFLLDPASALPGEVRVLEPWRVVTE